MQPLDRIHEAYLCSTIRSGLLDASGSNSFCKRPLEDQEKYDAGQDAQQPGGALRSDIHTILSLVNGQSQWYGHVCIRG